MIAMTIPRLLGVLFVGWAAFIAIVLLFLLKFPVPIEIPAIFALLFIVYFVWLPLSAWALGAREALLFNRTVSQIFDRLYFTLGYICGLELLLLGFFITYQVVARKLDWIQAPGADVMSGYVLAMAATWAFSYSLRSGAHVRIDVLLPYMGQKTRATADWIAMAAVLFLGWVTMWNLWETIASDYSRGKVTNDYPLTPVFIPKLVVAIGFSLLCVTAIQIMYTMVSESLLTTVNRLQGGGEIEALEVIEAEAAGAAD
jgi:TRAP-type C4-dicarboxylate transport system permease small subunit